MNYSPDYGMFNGWPGSYPSPTPIVPQPQKHTVIRVHGEEGAKDYNMGPNSEIILLDETQPVVWLKTTDGAGYPTVTGYDITPHVSDPKVIDIQKPEESKDSLIMDRLDRLERMMNELQSNAQSIRQQSRSGNNGFKSDQKHDRNVTE